MTKVSSTYLNQNLGWSDTGCMAFSSRSFTNGLAMMGDSGDPMGVPLICSKNSELEIL